MLGDIIGGISSIIGGFQAAKAQKKANQLQEKSMKKGIQWRVNDAKAAGIHPLAALGANVNTLNPVPVTGLGDGIAAGGAALGNAAKSYEAREAENLSKELLKSQIRQMDSVTSLNAARSRSVIASMRSSAVQEGLPLTGKLKPTNTAIRANGVDLPNAGWSDAEEVEAKYGDIVQNLYGAVNFGADLWKGYKDGPGKRSSQYVKKDRQINPNKYQWQEDY